MASGAGSSDGNVVVVTGATGYIASHIVKGLLADGRFTVRATVRDPSNEKKTKVRTNVTLDVGVVMDCEALQTQL